MFLKKSVGEDNFIVDSNVTIRFKWKNIRSRDRKRTVSAAIMVLIFSVDARFWAKHIKLEFCY